LVRLGLVSSKSSYVSHMTRMCGAPRKGSLKILMGFRNTSEFEPDACFVLEPS